MESQEQAFHPFHRPWKSRKPGVIPTFRQLRRLLIYKSSEAKPRPQAQTKRVGQIKLPKWAKYSCQTHPLCVLRVALSLETQSSHNIPVLTPRAAAVEL